MAITTDDFSRTKGKLVDDFKDVVENAENLLQATAKVTGES